MPDEPVKNEEQKLAEGAVDEIAASSRQGETPRNDGGEIASAPPRNNEEKASRDDDSLRHSERSEESLRNNGDELDKVKKERDEYLAGWQRAKADFLNYQKDERKRLEEFLKFCEAGLISDLLPVLDSFDLAILQLSNETAKGKENLDGKLKGFYLIKSQLDDILKKRGLEPIKSVGEKFNPEFHEAVATVETEGESQTIIEEIQKGYTLNGRTLRAAKVKIIK